MILLYNIATYILFFLALPFLLLHPKVRGHLHSRLGFHGPKANDEKWIWIHAASAGEVLAVTGLIKRLRERLPGYPVVLSTQTNSGLDMAVRTRSPVDRLVVAPVDLPGAISRFVHHFRPHLLILEYTELWPNLIRLSVKAGAKVILTNGRISKRGHRRSQKLKGLYARILPMIELFLMRTPGDAERIESLGAPVKRVVVTGNTKYDTPLPSPDEMESFRRDCGITSETPVWVVGNIHADEEEIVLPIFKRLKGDFPELKAVIAPRYIERCKEIEGLSRRLGLSTMRRTESRTDRDSEVIILDTVGELAMVYGVGWIAFVGGSFTNRGGQNIFEPARLGIPVCYGPNIWNFQREAEVLAGRGGIQVVDGEELESEIDGLLRNDQKRRSLGKQAAEAAGTLVGASEENVSLIMALLKG